MYEVIKLLHMSCAVLSFTGFFVRGILAFQGSYLMRSKLVRVLPHIIDTALLLSAFAMLYLSAWSVSTDTWLQAKIAVLIIYILLGAVALKDTTPKSLKLISWLSALLMFLFIVSVALTKNPLGILLVIL